MIRRNPLVLFFSILLPLLGITFLVHTTLLRSQDLFPYGNKIILSYIVNFLMAAGIYVGLFVFRNKIKTQIGFIFMAGSFLKFIIFFLLLYPSYKVDDDINSSEFAAFFVPYAICLAIETIFMVKMTQKMD